MGSLISGPRHTQLSLAPTTPALGHTTISSSICDLSLLRLRYRRKVSCLNREKKKELISCSLSLCLTKSLSNTMHLEDFWSNDWEQATSVRLPPVNAAFSFSRNFTNQVSQDQNSMSSSSCQYNQNYMLDNSQQLCQDESTLLCFPSIFQQSQLNLEETLQAVNDFDLSLIR